MSASNIPISFVVAMAANGVIGRDGDLPWRLPADMRFFRRITLHKPIIMGRRTYESIGRPLPKRTNIVLTRQPDYTADGCRIVHTVNDALSVARTAVPARDHKPEIMVIGGAAVYRAMDAYATRLYVTHIEADIDGDTVLAPPDPAVWCPQHVEPHPADEKNAYSFRIVRYERCASPAA